MHPKLFTPVRYRIICLLVMASLGPSAILAAPRGKEEAKVKAFLKDRPEAAKVALKERDPYLAACAFGSWVKGLKATDLNPESISVISGVAARDGMFYRVALMLAISPTAKQSSAYLAENGQPRLAAALVAERGLLSHWRRAKRVSTRMENAKGVLAAAYGKPVGRKTAGAKAASIAGIPVPPSLLQGDQDAETLELAILGAAWGRDKTAAEAIKALNPKSAGAAAARMLYLTALKQEVDATTFENVANGCVRAGKALSQTDPSQTNWDPRAPALCYMVEAMGISGKDKYRGFLENCLFHADYRVQMDAVRSLRRLGSEPSLPALQRRLLKADWPVLVEVAQSLSESPSKTSVEPLLHRLQNEEGRFRLDLIYALSSIAGESHGGTFKEWVTWWKQASRDFKVDAQRSKLWVKEKRIQSADIPAYGQFYGLSIYSTAFSIVVDSSASMRGARIKSLKENLLETVRTLKPGPKYNMIDFGGDVILMSEKGLIDQARQAERYVDKIELTWATRSFDAIERAAATDNIDTLFFLSDGAPVGGQVANWKHIHAAWSLLNRYRPIAVSTINFDPSPGGLINMRLMAAENVGLSTEVQ